MTVASAGSAHATSDTTPRSERRRFANAAAAGSILSTAIYLWMLLGPHLNLFSGRGLLSSFLDAQARALLHGHLYVSAAQASIEGFSLRGHSYLYFGMWPTVLRLPVLLITHSLDGRLTQLSMLVAFVVLMAGSATLHWQIRGLVRPQVALGRADLSAAALVQVLVGAGSVVLYLAGWQVVYHETELWGAALAIAGISGVVAVSRAPTRKRIAGAGLLALLAVHSRPSVGLAPLLALILLAGAMGARMSVGWCERWSRRRLARWAKAVGEQGACSEPASWRSPVAVLAAGVVPLLSYVALQYAKFHMLGLPVTRQVGVNLDPMARASVAANHGSVFGLKFVPSTLLAAVRPDAVGTVRAFPFVGLPHAEPTTVGHVLLESVQPSLSAVTSMPLLCLLTLVGLVAVARRRTLRGLVVMLIATTIGVLPVLAVSDIATRYMSDALPLLVLGGLIGLHTLIAGGAQRPRRARNAALIVVGAVLIGWGIVVNGGAGLVLQRLLAPDTSEADRAAFVGFQQSVDNFLGRRPHGVQQGSRLPRRSTGAPGSLFIVGRCAGLYATALDDSWLPVERTPETGLHELTFSPPASPRTQALLTLGSGRGGVTLALGGPAGAARLLLLAGEHEIGASAPVTLAGRSAATVSIVPFAGRYSATVSLGGRRLFAAFVPDENLPQTFGADPGNPAVARFSGRIEQVPLTAPVCRRIARAGGLPTG